MYEGSKVSLQGAHGEMIVCVNETDEQGNPAGGHALGRGLAIQYQPGPVLEIGAVVGAFVEDPLIAVLERLRWYQKGHFSCEENAVAIKHVEAALTC